MVWPFSDSDRFKAELAVLDSVLSRGREIIDLGIGIGDCLTGLDTGDSVERILDDFGGGIGVDFGGGIVLLLIPSVLLDVNSTGAGTGEIV